MALAASCLTLPAKAESRNVLLRYEMKSYIDRISLGLLPGRYARASQSRSSGCSLTSPSRPDRLIVNSKSRTFTLCVRSAGPRQSRHLHQSIAKPAADGGAL